MKRLAAVATLLLFASCPAAAQEDRNLALEAGLGPSCKSRYDTYLLGPYPRAFALSADRKSCGYSAGGESRETVEAAALRICGANCAIAARSPELLPDAEITPADMRPAQRDPTSRHRGPGEAVGAIVWSPGSTPDRRPSRNSTAPFVRPFNEAKWDVWRVDRLEPGQNTLKGAIEVLNQAIDRVKSAGYRRIVLAGQSVGGFLSLALAARRTDIDAVIATAPAIRGDLTDKKPQELQRVLREFDAIFSRRANPNTRLAVALFDKDEYEPSAAQRVTIMERRARNDGWPILLIERPEGLTGHNAGRGVPFAQRYRDCLMRFVELPTLPAGAHDCAEIMRLSSR
jgi:pimeloyl-ACP methyl ester carboxylesterase